MSDEKKPVERRGFPRWSAPADGTLLVDGQTHDCQLLDYSASGALIATAAALEVGRTVTLQMSGMVSMQAVVVRDAENATYGLCFEEGPYYAFS